jgi:hypothetical protein
MPCISSRQKPRDRMLHFSHSERVCKKSRLVCFTLSAELMIHFILAKPHKKLKASLMTYWFKK